MKLIQCVIRQEKLMDVIEKLSKIVPGLTVAEVRGRGRQGGHQVIYRGVEYSLALLPKVRVEIVIDDNKVEDVVNAVCQSANTGEIGDGRIFVIPVDHAYHVRTGFMEID
jgi:nitrogen regulatory protein P-II 1